MRESSAGTGRASEQSPHPLRPAGINDLTRGQAQPSAILPGLEKIWRMALDSGANVLAIPPLQSVNWGE